MTPVRISRISMLALMMLLAPFLSVARSAAETTSQLRQAANAGTVGVIAGGVDGTYIRIATDLAAVLDRPGGPRILPLVGRGSLQNLIDIAFLRGVDIGIVQSDALAYAKKERTIPGIDRSIQYIAKLYDEEIHILARRGTALSGLAGKRVNVDLAGSGTAMTAALVFHQLGLAVATTNFDQSKALEKLKSGEINALVYVSGKPARLFSTLTADDDLQFVAVPGPADLLETYLPAQLTHSDYQIIPEKAPIETVAIGAVMAVYNLPRDTERYRKVAAFVDAFFDNFAAFLEPPRHPKWKEVHLAAQVPGWTRFAAVDDWLKRKQAAATAEGSSERARDSGKRGNY